MNALFISIIKFLVSGFRYVQSLFFKFRLSLMKYDFKEIGSGSTFALNVYFKGKESISIGSNTKIDSFSAITAWTNYRGQGFHPQLKIGSDCRIGAYNHITAVERITIGDGALTGKWVTITDNSHGQLVADQIETPPAFRPLFSKGEVIIGKNVWICDKATITAGVTIGDGCIIAANAVVTKSVPPYSLVAGNPARVMKSLDISLEKR